MYTVLWEPEDGRYSKELRGTIVGLRIPITIGTRMLGYRDSPPSVLTFYRCWHQHWKMWVPLDLAESLLLSPLEPCK